MGKVQARLGSARALFLILFCGLALAMSFLVGGTLQDRKDSSEAQKAASAYAESARIEINALCRKLAGPDRAYCLDKAARSQREQQRNEYQLQAERENANWTLRATQAGIASLLFTVITVVAVFITFEQQGRANRISLSSARANQRSAQRSLAHAQWVSQQELRPYVFVDKITSEQVTDRIFKITVWLKNFGQTPARNLHTIVTTYVTYDLHKLKPHKPRADRIELGTVAPNAHRRALSRLMFSEKQWESPRFDQAWGVIRIKYSYTDDPGENSFSEEFDYHTAPDELVRDEPTFFLLTTSRVRDSKRLAARQGEFMLQLRRRRRAQRKKPEEDDELER